jgi:multidrug efflux system outer membrane protein
MQKQRYAAGVSSEFEFRQREAEYEGALAQLPPAEEALAKQERALLILLGRSAKGVINDRIERTSTNTAPARLPAGMPSTLILNRPDVREAEQKLIAANARIGVARAAFFPSISLTGNIGGESGALADLFSGPARTWKFAGDLTQPLWGAGRLFAAQDAANARNEQAVQAYRSAVANAFKEVADAIAAHARASQVAEAETKRVAALTRTWQLAKLRFEKGVSSQLDVIDAERGLLQAEFDRIAAERDLRLAVADLYKALGGAATPAS